MSVFSFIYYYHKNTSIGNVYKSCQINISGLKFANNRLYNKKKVLVKASFRISTTLLDDWPRVILISKPW